MGWAYCGTDRYGREIGYGIEATCDRRGCNEEIDRGLGCVCGGMHGGDEGGCGRYYCDRHGGGWRAGPRGGCVVRHRGRHAWGKTKCQLLRRDVDIDRSFDPEARRWTTTPGEQYFCACHGWEDAEVLPVDTERYKRIDGDKLRYWRTFPDFVAHVEARGFRSRMEGDDEYEDGVA